MLVPILHNSLSVLKKLVTVASRNEHYSSILCLQMVITNKSINFKTCDSIIQNLNIFITG